MTDQVDDLLNLKTDFMKFSPFSDHFERVFKGVTLQSFQSKIRKALDKKGNKEKSMSSLSEICKNHKSQGNLEVVSEDIFSDDYKERNNQKSSSIFSSPINLRSNQISKSSSKNLLSGPGKYNPNFNAIFKHVPITLIKSPKHSVSKEKQKKINLEEEKNLWIQKKLQGKEKKTIESKQKSTLLLTLNSQMIERDNLYSDASLSKLNQRIHLDKNSNRKSPNHSTLKSNSNVNLLNTYLSKKLIDQYSSKSNLQSFGKINKKQFDHNYDIPAICTYKPNYDYLEKKKPLITLSQKADSKRSKSYSIHKILKSYYCVGGEYKAVNL